MPTSCAGPSMAATPGEPSHAFASPSIPLQEPLRVDIRTATDQLRAKVGEDCGLGAVLKFDCGADGAVVIDATKVPNGVSNDADRVADCTVALSVDTLGDLLSGE